MLKFSIIVPVYNAERYLYECVYSVLNQTYQNFELILVDDGSKDSSGLICEDLKGKDNRIIVLHKENGGVSSARNLGFTYADGDYLLFLDADDFLDYNALDYFYRNLKIKSVDLLLGTCFFNNKNQYSTKEVLFSIDRIKDSSYDSILEFLFDGSHDIPFAIWHNVFNTNHIKSNEIRFDKGLKYSEDADFVSTVLFSTDNIGFCDDCFYHYRTDNSMATTKNPSFEKLLNRISVNKKWFYKVNDMNISAPAKNNICRWYAEHTVETLKVFGKITREEEKILNNLVLKDRFFLSFVKDKKMKAITLLSKTIGLRTTNRLFLSARAIKHL